MYRHFPAAAAGSGKSGRPERPHTADPAAERTKRRTMTKTIVAKDPANDSPAFDFIRTLLRGAGQVMFQNDARTGLFFLAGIFWGAYEAGRGVVAWGAVAGLVAATLAGRLLRLPEKEGAQGLWGFNGILAGCAIPTFSENTGRMWAALILCAALTTWVRTGFNRATAPWKINSLTFPFVFCTWIFLLAARSLEGLPSFGTADPSFPEHAAAIGHVGFVPLIVAWLKGIAQVFLIDSWAAGLLLLAGLFVANRAAGIWAAVGSALALCAALLFGAPETAMLHGLYGYSPVLTAVALATVFHKPGMRSALWALLGIVVTVFVQAAADTLAAPFGVAALTAPFCITTWLFLLPLIRLDGVEKPDHTDWYHEGKRHPAEPATRTMTPQARRPAAAPKPGTAPKPSPTAGPGTTTRPGPATAPETGAGSGPRRKTIRK